MSDDQGPKRVLDANLNPQCAPPPFFIDNILVRIRFMVEMVWWTGLATWGWFGGPVSRLGDVLVVRPRDYVADQLLLHDERRPGSQACP